MQRRHRVTRVGGAILATVPRGARFSWAVPAHVPESDVASVEDRWRPEAAARMGQRIRSLRLVPGERPDWVRGFRDAHAVRILRSVSRLAGWRRGDAAPQGGSAVTSPCVRRCAAALGILLATGPVFAAELPPPRLLRWEEDYRGLAARARAGDPVARLKHLELAEGLSLSFGAQARATYERRGVPFGPRRQADDALFTRLLLHGDLRIGEQARLFLELGSHAVAGKRAPLAPADRNRLDLQQAFLDVGGSLGPGALALRLGRQEFAFDAQRFVTVRNGPNVRQTFDAARLDWTAPGGRLTAFAAQPVENRDLRAFDDRGDAGIRFAGLRAETPRLAGTPLGAALYGYRYERDGARFGAVRANETRNVLGGRATWAGGGFDADLEAMLQGGRFADREVLAWAVGSTAGKRLASLPWAPRLGIQFDLASGDDNPRDGRLATFNPLFPRGNNFTDASYTGFSNLIHFKPNLILTPRADTRLLLAAGWLWRHTAQDAVYAQPFVPVAGTAGNGGGRRTGSYGQLRVEVTLARGTDLVVEAVHFLAGPALTASGGRDSTYVKAEFSFRY